METPKSKNIQYILDQKKKKIDLEEIKTLQKQHIMTSCWDLDQGCRVRGLRDHLLQWTYQKYIYMGTILTEN